MAIARLLCSALVKSNAVQKGLKINPKTLKINSVCSDCIRSGKKDLLQLGFNKKDAEMLVRQGESKETLLDTVRLYDGYDARSHLLNFVREQEKEQIALWGRTLNLSKKNKLVYDKVAMDQDVMLLTRKHRVEQNFKNGFLKCEEIPDGVKFTPEERASKAILDKGFENLPGTQYEMMQYRGEVIPGNDPYVKNLLSLKEGDVFEMPGYAWTTDSKKYAFETYSGENAADMDWFKIFDRYSFKYHILCPPNTKIMASRSRMGQEFILPCDSKMKLVKKVVDDNGRFVEIFCEHIPKKSLETLS